MSVRKVSTQDGNTKWEVRIYMNGRNSKRVTRRFDTRSEADAFFQDQKLERKRLSVGLPNNQAFEKTTFETEANFWLQFHKNRFSHAHYKNADFFLKKLLPRYGSLSPEKFHPGLLSEIQSELLNAGLKPSSVNRHLQVVVTVLNFAAKQRRIPLNPGFGFRNLKEVRDDIRYWEKDEAIDFLQFIHRKYPVENPKRWVYVVYLFAINTAARAGEIWGLKPPDLQPNGEVILIQRQFNQVLGAYTSTKGKKNRRVPCNANLLRELQTLIQTNGIKENETIFQNEMGRPISHDNFVKRQFRKDLKEWGGKKIRFHDLRHTGATLMAGSGIDLKTVQEVCGHENIKTTMNYAHLLAERIRDAARSFVIAPLLVH